MIDGTNSPANTTSVASQLHALGYRIVPTTASNYVGPVSETTVVYAKGHLDQAERVLSSLSGTAVMAEAQPVAGAEISVIAGSDLSVDHVTTKALVTGTKTPQRFAVGSRCPGGWRQPDDNDEPELLGTDLRDVDAGAL